MSYIPFHIACLDALQAAFEAGFNAELEELGQTAMPVTGFQYRDPQLIAGESLVVYYDHMAPGLVAKYWTDALYIYAVHMISVQPDARSLNRRLMLMEFAARQVVSKNRNLGGLTRTVHSGDSIPWRTSQNKQGTVADSMFIPIVCQPDERIPNPERSLP